MIFLLCVAALDVRFVAKVEPRSWQPIEPKDVERIIEQKALDQLTKKGALKLTKGGFADLKSGDYSLLIEGRFIEEAEKFSAYLTFGPGMKTALPSFYVIDTSDVMSGRSPQEMQKTIMALVERAANRLNGLLEPHLGISDAPMELTAVPVDFGFVMPGPVKNPTAAMNKLLNVRNPDHVRWEGYNELHKSVFDQPAARETMERCMLADPLAKLRASCTEALAPAARTNLETQRLILSAMRTEVDASVLKAMADVSKSFTGVSHKEAVATWLDVMSADGTPVEATDDFAKLIADENNVPNLGLALTRCFNSEVLVYGKRNACAQYLLTKIPQERRIAVVYRFFENTRIGDISESNLMSDLEQNVFGRGSEPLDPKLAELLQRVVLQPRFLPAQHTLIYALRRHPTPTPATIEVFLRALTMSEKNWVVFNSLPDLTKAHPEMRDEALKQLKAFQASHTFMRRPHSGDPNKDLQKTIERIERQK